jgi:hypothetical protein
MFIIMPLNNDLAVIKIFWSVDRSASSGKEKKFSGNVKCWKKMGGITGM